MKNANYTVGKHFENYTNQDEPAHCNHCGEANITEGWDVVALYGADQGMDVQLCDGCFSLLFPRRAAAAAMGRAKSPAKTAAARANGAKGGRPAASPAPEAVQLVTPWSGATPPDRNMSWTDIRAWAADSVHERDRNAWLRAARRYYRRNDGAALGRMVTFS